MSTVYQTKLIGTGTSEDPVRPSGFGPQADGSYVSFTTLFTNDKKSPNTIVLSSRDNVTGTNILAIDTAPTPPELAAKLKVRTITNQERNQMNQFLGQGNQSALPSEVTLWWDALYHAAIELNPAIDLNAIFGVA